LFGILILRFLCSSVSGVVFWRADYRAEAVDGRFAMEPSDSAM
jgi:hypothetical protein